METKDSLVALAEHDIHVWLKLYGIKTEAGTPLDFKNHLFLVEPFEDLSPKQTIMKAAQVGFSTMAILKCLWLAKTKGIAIAYTLPTTGDAQEFVTSKVNRIITQNPILEQYVKKRDAVSQKEVGDSIIFFRGTFLEKQAITITCDLLVHDEEDRSDQNVIGFFSSRLQHSKYKWAWHFSNPSSSGSGVSKYWPLSDQRHWFIKCGSCKKEQYLSWPDSVDMERRIYVCKECGFELSNEDRRVGRWVKKVLKAEYVGYWISALMCPWLSADYIIREFETKPKDYFFNFVLGLPYVGEGNTVTPETIYQNLTGGTPDQVDCVIGCDSGIIKHYVVGNRDGLLSLGKTEDWEDIARLLRRLPRSIAVLDAMPDITGPRKLREDFPGRVFLCHYAKDRKTMELIRWGKGVETGSVLVDRNRMMQVVIDELNEMRLPIFGTRDEWEPMVEHFMTLYRVTEQNSLGTPEFSWETNNGQDHFAHALVYCRVGMAKKGLSPGSIVMKDKLQVPRGIVIGSDPFAP